MTFLELHKVITQTRKARKGIKRYEDFWEGEEPNAEAFYNAVYKRALQAANEVIKHYEAKCEYDPEDKPVITWRGSK